MLFVKNNSTSNTSNSNSSSYDNEKIDNSLNTGKNDNTSHDVYSNSTIAMSCEYLVIRIRIPLFVR